MTMARMKFLCDAERCIECNGCVTACKNEHEVPWGVNRRRVVTHQRRRAGREDRSRWPACTAPTRPAWRSARSTASTAPTTAWCCTTRTSASAAATASTPARSARRSSRRRAPSACAARWTSAPSAPAARRQTASEAEFEKYGRNRLAEGKLPPCAEMCSTKALLGGDGDVVADIYRDRVVCARQGHRGLGLGHGLRPEDGRLTRPPKGVTRLLPGCARPAGRIEVTMDVDRFLRPAASTTGSGPWP